MKRLWDHPYCERAMRVSPGILVFVILPSFLWFRMGLSETPGLFARYVLGIPVLVLGVAIPAGWLSRDNLRRSWGWLFGLTLANEHRADEAYSEYEARLAAGQQTPPSNTARRVAACSA